MPKDYLGIFIESVKLAPTDKDHETLVRNMLARTAKKCPMPVLIKLGHSLIEARKSEIRDQSERN